MMSVLAAIVLLNAISAFGVTVRLGFEGPALLGGTLETVSGLYLYFGTSPPLTIFGGEGTWSFSFSGGFARPLRLFESVLGELRIVPRISAGVLITEKTALALVPGILAEATWKIASTFRIGVQAGVSMCLFLRIDNLEPDLFLTGQIGLVGRF